MKQFYVRKESHTYSDTIEALGLASIIDDFLGKIFPEDKPEIIIKDKGFYYELSLSREIENEMIENCPFFDIIPYVANKNDDLSKLSFHFINYEKEREIQNRYYDMSKKEKKETEYATRPDYDIIRMFANMDGYRKSFYNCRKFEYYFAEFLKFILKFYSLIDEDRIQLLNEFTGFMKENKIKPSNVGALQEINPEKGKGVNEQKANGIKLKGQKEFWLRQMIRFKGVWISFVSRYFGKDLKTYSLAPNEISFDNLSTVYKNFKLLIRGKDSIKMDILLIQLMTKELIKHDTQFQNKNFFILPKDKIFGFHTVYYKNLGQRPAVTNIGFLGLPSFIRFHSRLEGVERIDLLEEHQRIISQIDEGNSSNISMLQEYRQFISAGDFGAFFEFSYDYGQFLISSLLNKKYFIGPFSIQKMEVLMKTNPKYQEILSNEGFQAVASAIRNSTIIPILHNNKKDVIFGLSQKFRIASRHKESLASEVSGFIQKYNENVMLKDYHQQLHQRYVTTEEMEEFFKLLDEDYSPKLIAGMLIAYGYAKNPTKENLNEEE